MELGRRATKSAATAVAVRGKRRAMVTGMWPSRSCRTCRHPSGVGGIPASVWMTWLCMCMSRARRSGTASVGGILTRAGLRAAVGREECGGPLRGTASLRGILRLVVPRPVQCNLVVLRGILRPRVLLFSPKQRRRHCSCERNVRHASSALSLGRGLNRGREKFGGK